MSAVKYIRKELSITVAMLLTLLMMFGFTARMHHTSAMVGERNTQPAEVSVETVQDHFSETELGTGYIFAENLVEFG